MFKSQNPRYTIFNYGTPHSFNPLKKVINPYTNKEGVLLDVHKEKVKEAKDPLVFIVDETGQIV